MAERVDGALPAGVGEDTGFGRFEARGEAGHDLLVVRVLDLVPVWEVLGAPGELLLVEEVGEEQPHHLGVVGHQAARQ
ncbi:hypothetical protein GCM10023235_38920 [Kitasatospora terrestris]|uniref:Uncharacterized protein n=1 Tax=Kitasatospora terrestris TaxID=258051 RepID=A0ABP9DUY3_9ACTN